MVRCSEAKHLLPRIAGWYLVLLLCELLLIAQHSPLWNDLPLTLLVMAGSSFRLSRLGVPPRWLLGYGALGSVCLLPRLIASVQPMLPGDPQAAHLACSPETGPCGMRVSSAPWARRFSNDEQEAQAGADHPQAA